MRRKYGQDETLRNTLEKEILEITGTVSSSRHLDLVAFLFLHNPTPLAWFPPFMLSW